MMTESFKSHPPFGIGYVNPATPRHKCRGLLRVDPERRSPSTPLKAVLSAVERVKKIFFLAMGLLSLSYNQLVVYPKNITIFDSLLDGLQSTQALSEIWCYFCGAPLATMPDGFPKIHLVRSVKKSRIHWPC
jgi:hypothetical protein